jgi:pimeloyl-ACP methyl ester carboxylesterase
MIGQWLGANAGSRLTHLVLANTSPKVADPRIFGDRRKMVLETGMAAAAEAAIQRFFLPETAAAGVPAVGSIRNVLMSTNPLGYGGCCAAIRDMDQTGSLDRISVPVLVIAGDHDTSLPGVVMAKYSRSASAAHAPYICRRRICPMWSGRMNSTGHC